MRLFSLVSSYYLVDGRLCDKNRKTMGIARGQELLENSRIVSFKISKG